MDLGCSPTLVAGVPHTVAYPLKTTQNSEERRHTVAYPLKTTQNSEERRQRRADERKENTGMEQREKWE